MKSHHHPEINQQLIHDCFGQDFMGVPDGKGVTKAYAYCRIATMGTSGRLIDLDIMNESARGLKRQLDSINEKAKNEGIHIPSDMVYIEVAAAASFVDRPVLTMLREEYLSPNRRASRVVMEAIDRLSRNTDWHQSFLTDEMQKAGVTAVYCQEPQERIHRVVVASVDDIGKHGGFKGKLRKGSKRMNGTV